MTIPYFYEPFIDDNILQLSDANMHHMLHVLRMRDNEEIIVTDGKGKKCIAKLVNVSKKTCDLQITGFSFAEKRKFNLHIAISFTKNLSRIEWFLEKATELGIETITPLITHRSEKIFFKKERFEKILISAMLQSQQEYLPVLNEPTVLKNLDDATYDQKFIAYCGNEYEKQQLHKVLKPSADTIFLIGPEGDFTQEEVHLCKQNGYEVVQLGNNRLRTETAGLYVCTLFNAIQ